MREYGGTVYLASPDADITLEMLAEAGPLVEAAFNQARIRVKELASASYQFVAGPPTQAGKHYFHPFGWYVRLFDGTSGDRHE